MASHNIRNYLLEITDLDTVFKSGLIFVLCFFTFFLNYFNCFRNWQCLDSVKFLNSKGFPMCLWFCFCLVFSVVSSARSVFLFQGFFVWLFFPVQTYLKFGFLILDESVWVLQSWIFFIWSVVDVWSPGRPVEEFFTFSINKSVPGEQPPLHDDKSLSNKNSVLLQDLFYASLATVGISRLGFTGERWIRLLQCSLE